MRFIFTVIICLITLFPVASQDSTPSNPYHKYQLDKENKSPIVKRMYSPAGEETIVDEESGSTVNHRWIIEFKGDPAVKDRKTGRSDSRTYRSVLQKFEEDLSELSKSSSNTRSTGAIHTEIKHEYYKSFFGVSADFPIAIKSEIDALPYVERVIPDYKVKTQIIEGGEIIKANTYKSLTGADGSGIKIGVIDTGIDYNHPDLGGGYGDGFKVKGGYDFVNDDNDPLDNNGHGTHVAGIIAAEGSEISGIAPKAELYALKALSREGSGYTSDIISAIEWTMDPNNDDDFSDKLDIVNMSLGGPGDANSPLSKAVDNAVEAGIIYCVAAGNDGDYYLIGSPGSARDAITVGATSKQNTITWFSSKGPTPTEHLMKPDVVAPGEFINSTHLDNSYRALSGTSMATPFVAGAAALLLQKHADWSPKDVKFALMSSATKLEDADVWEQGTGLINLLKADSVSFQVDPASISFGIVNSNESFWQKMDTLVLTNTSQRSKVYQLTKENNLPLGTDLILDTHAVEVGPGDSAIVRITLSVDVNRVPASASYPPAYTSNIIVSDGNGDFMIPVSFIKGNNLKINFGATPDLVYIHDRVSQEYRFSLKGESFNRPFQNGVYDIVVFYNGFTRIVVREGVDLSGDVELNLSPSEAIHEVVLKGISPGGKELPIISGFGDRITHKESGMDFGVIIFGFYFGTPPKSMKRYFSDLSDAYSFQSSLMSIPSWNDENQFFQFPVFIDDGISSSLTYQNSPNDFKKLVTQYESPSADAKLFYTKGYISFGIGSSFYIYDGANPSYNTLTYPFLKEEFILPSPNENYVMDAVMYEDVFKMEEGQEFQSLDSLTLLYNSPRIVTRAGMSGVEISRYGWGNGRILGNHPYAKIHMGQSPPFPDRGPYIFESSINFDYGHFINAFLDIKHADVTYELKSEGAVIYSDTIANAPKDFNYDQIQLPIEDSKVYNLTFTYADHTVNGTSGTASWSANISKDSYYVPSFSSLNLSANDRVKSAFSSDEDIDVKFSFGFNNGTRFFYKRDGLPDWNELLLTKEENIYDRGTIEAGLSEGEYSIRITNEKIDYEYKVEPAFQIINPFTSDSLALVALFNSTEGANWTTKEGWLQGPLSAWYGVTTEDDRVVAIDLNSNHLNGTIPIELDELTQLKTLNLNNNRIANIPDLSGLPHLQSLNVANNQLKFQDLEPSASIDQFIYSPQDSIGYDQIIIMEQGDPFVYKSAIENANYHYQWFKNDSSISYIDTSEFVINAIGPNDAGSYHFTITHDVLTDLTLVAKPTLVQVHKRIFKRISVGPLVNSSANTSGGSWGDYDNDGDEDLYVSNRFGNNMLYRNLLMDQGLAEFEEALSAGEMVERQGRSYASTWGDIDNDGYLDLFVSIQNPLESNYLFHNEQNGNFTRLRNEGLTDEGNASRSAAWGDYNNDGNLDIFVANQQYYQFENSQNQLFNGNGDGTFQEQAFTNEPNSNFISWADYDSDGDLDLFTGDFWAIFQNEFDSTFSHVGIDIMGSGPVKGASWGDCDNDGDLDLFVITENDYCFDCVSSNTLLRNDGNNTFTNLNELGFSADSLSAYGSTWADYDNDGDLDIVVTNSNGKDLIWKNLLLESGELKFEKITYGALYNSEDISSACAVADYDRDGDLDLFKASFDGNDRLFENVIGSENNWLEVKCIGTFTNNAAIGTKIRLNANIEGESRWQLREISAQTGLSAQNSLVAHFGLNKASVIDTLVVEWPSGHKKEYTDLDVNQLLEITEPSLVILQPDDVAIHRRSEAEVTINTLYDGADALKFLALTDIDEIDVAFDRNSLSINSNEWFGTTKITVYASHGIHSDSASFYFTVSEITSLSSDLSLESVTLKTYPNPSFGNVTFDLTLDKPSEVDFTIYNRMGKKVLAGQSDHDVKHLIQVDLSIIPKGLYIVSFHTDQVSFQNKVIIE